MSADDPLAPVAKLDPEKLIDRIARATGVRLELLGRPAGGEVGAAYVHTPDGAEGVLTAIGQRPPEEVRLAGDVLQRARDRGLPVPTYRQVFELPARYGSNETPTGRGLAAVVQEALPGKAPPRADRGLIEQMIEANARMSGLLADRPEVPVPDLFLTHSGPGFCVHESLQAYGGRAQRLLDWVREVGAETADGRTAIDGTDLVHLDFHPGNVLVDNHGRLTGIVDWDALHRGDRRFDLVTLRYEAAAAGLDTETIRWLDGLLDEVLEPERLRAFWAHMSLRSVDWVIRHYSPADVDARLELAETRMR